MFVFSCHKTLLRSIAFRALWAKPSVKHDPYLLFPVKKSYCALHIFAHNATMHGQNHDRTPHCHSYDRFFHLIFCSGHWNIQVSGCVHWKKWNVVEFAYYFHHPSCSSISFNESLSINFLSRITAGHHGDHSFGAYNFWCDTSSLPPPPLLLLSLLASLTIVPLGPTTFGAAVQGKSKAPKEDKFW